MGTSLIYLLEWVGLRLVAFDFGQHRGIILTDYVLQLRLKQYQLKLNPPIRLTKIARTHSDLGGRLDSRKMRQQSEIVISINIITTIHIASHDTYALYLFSAQATMQNTHTPNNHVRIPIHFSSSPHKNLSHATQSTLSPPNIPTPQMRNRFIAVQEHVRLVSNSKVSKKSVSSHKVRVRKLSSNMFRQAHMVHGQTYLTKDYPISKTTIKSQQLSKNNKGEDNEINQQRHPRSNESKLSINNVMDVNLDVQGAESDLTRLINNLEIDTPNQSSKLFELESIPQILPEPQAQALKKSQFSQTLMDFLKAI